ncbi:L-threonylcarbamoyladenylate synthase [Halothermothrix orenii]|nr:L-threonylcarbamoyladenylate synthase [Halothermothrix orenii]
MEYKTRIGRVNRDLIKKQDILKLKENDAIREGASLLQKGEVVAFPTETVYGLGADATSESAVKKIFKAKGRPRDNPLIVHIGEMDQLYDIIKNPLSDTTRRLIKHFWPGPLTLIFEKKETIPGVTTAGLESVAVRFPDNPVARALIGLSSVPVAAPSANLSGSPSPTRAEHVFKDLKGRIPFIIDGGPSSVGVESTVIDIRSGNPVILRPGGVTREEIAEVTGFSPENPDNEDRKKPLSPGMKYRHYSPRTPLYLIEIRDFDKIRDVGEKYKGYNLALVITSETDMVLKESLKSFSTTGIKKVVIGSRNDFKKIAACMFDILRNLDTDNIDLIFFETIPEKGLGEAIMNRLAKAATGKIVVE